MAKDMYTRMVIIRKINAAESGNILQPLHQCMAVDVQMFRCFRSIAVVCQIDTDGMYIACVIIPVMVQEFL